MLCLLKIQRHALLPKAQQHARDVDKKLSKSMSSHIKHEINKISGFKESNILY